MNSFHIRRKSGTSPLRETPPIVQNEPGKMCAWEALKSAFPKSAFPLFDCTAKNGAASSITAQPNEPAPSPPGGTAFPRRLLSGIRWIEILCHILTIVANRFRVLGIGKRLKKCLPRLIFVHSRHASSIHVQIRAVFWCLLFLRRRVFFVRQTFFPFVRF